MIIAVVYLVIGLGIMAPIFYPRAKEAVEEMMENANISRNRSWISYWLGYLEAVLLWPVIVGVTAYAIVQEHCTKNKEL